MILEVKNLYKYFFIERGIFKKQGDVVRALEEINLSVDEFQVLGIVGESGSGKTTLAKIILRLIPPTSGKVLFNERLIRDFRKDVQIIFQNPYNSLNPKMRIGDAISEPLLIHRILPARHIRKRVLKLLEMVGLGTDIVNRYPIEFSGGERQRICLARSLASEPRFIVLDEPISSLDLTIQSRLIDLLRDLKERLKLTYIFISHNLAVVKQLADSVCVMQNGRILEQGSCEDIFKNPCNSYTKFLLMKNLNP